MLGGSDLATHSVTLLFAAITGVGVPWIGMRMLVPTLLRSGVAVRNYRGVEVVTGLGLVWALWCVGLAAYIAGFSAILPAEAILPRSPGAASVLGLALPLVGAAFLFGLVDDVFGTATEKGFRGHLGALRRGRFTTGGLKLVGIGAVSVIGAGWYAAGVSGGRPLEALAHTVVAAAVLALASNTLNLFDLRPGRALKVYTLLAAVALAALGVRWAFSAVAEPLGVVSDVATLAIFCAGPVLAVWRYDLGETGMLGDAGANALGMLVGVLFVAALPFAALLIPLVLLLGLNVASEKVSFSAVIERTRVLAALDGWGRHHGVSGEPEKLESIRSRGRSRG